jgi:hypothetical protein
MLAWRLFSAGVRRRNAPLVFVGGALAVLVFVRRLDGPKRQLVHAETLSGRNRVMVGLLGPDDPGGQRSR